MRKIFIGALASLSLTGLLLMAGCACSATPSTGDMTGITVSASSETQVVPDRAQITVAVRSQAKTAEACQEANARDVNAVIESLLALGVAEEDIQTEWTNLSPIQDFGTEPVPSNGSAIEPAVATPSPSTTSEGAPAASSSDAEADKAAAPSDDGTSPAADSTAPDAEYSNIVGYEAYTSLSVKGLDIDAVSAIAAAAVSAGATDVSGIRYYASSYDEAYEAALQDAIDQARQKAQSLADAAGVRLGGVVAVTEGYQDTGYRYAQNAIMESAAFDAGGSDAKTMPGQIDITAQVTVRFAIA